VVQARSPLGPVVAVTGAALLALSVFLPWYSVSITATGAAYAQQAMSSVAQQYGNATLQAAADTVGSRFSALAGHPLGTVTAHETLKTLSVVLLLLAAAAFVGALVWLAEANAPIEVDGRQVAAAGVVAALVVLFRMVDHPGASSAFVSLSLSWGIWLALVSSAAIVAGGVIGRR